jgi:peptide/nickel transport system permease protein
MPVQYWHYLVQLAHGDLGTSFTQFPVKVTDIIAAHLPWTLFLVGTATLIAFVLGTVLGIICSWRRGGFLDSLIVPLTAVTSSFPVFFLALLLVYYLASTLGWFPTGHNFEPGNAPHLSLAFIGDMLYHAVLPAFTLVITSVGGWILGMRNAMINTLAEDYVTMASAKGLSDRRVMIWYAARNAILPQITAFSMALGFAIGGAFLVELVFSYEGVGFFLINAVTAEDYPLIEGLLLLIVVCVLIANFAVDLLYARLDPRVRRS